SAALGAAADLVGADRDDPGEHVAQVASDGDLFHRIGDDAVLHPVARCATGVVPGDVVDALPHQVGHEQPGAQAPEHGVQVVGRPGAPTAQAQVVGASRIASSAQAQL